MAVAAFPLQPEPSENGHIIVRTYRLTAIGTVRRFPHYGHPPRHAIRDDIQKTADARSNEAEPQRCDEINNAV